MGDQYEISIRFRRMMEQRIFRLETDATLDEAHLCGLENVDHIRRQMRLVAAQRAEARRMRLFLEQSRTRVQPTNAG